MSDPLSGRLQVIKNKVEVEFVDVYVMLCFLRDFEHRTGADTFQQSLAGKGQVWEMVQNIF